MVLASMAPTIPSQTEVPAERSDQIEPVEIVLIGPFASSEATNHREPDKNPQPTSFSSQVIPAGRHYSTSTTHVTPDVIRELRELERERRSAEAALERQRQFERSRESMNRPPVSFEELKEHRLRERQQREERRARQREEWARNAEVRETEELNTSIEELTEEIHDLRQDLILRH
jgi:hypothetical protein